MAAVVVPVVVATIVIVHQLVQPDALTGTSGYDDGVYMGASLLLWRGVLPYADFTFLHPPGILLVLGPSTLLSHVVGEASAFVLARLLTAGIGVVNVGLAAFVVRRHGALAMFSAGIVLATFPASVAAVPTVTLEPWMILFSLLALALLFDGSGRVAGRRRQVLAGAMLGAGLLVKLWVAAVVLPVVVVVLLASGKRAALRVAAAASIVFAVPMAWFALVTRGDVVAQVIGTQAGRERTGTWALPIVQRLSAITGHTYPVEAAVWWVLPVVVVVTAGVVLTVWVRRQIVRPVDATIVAVGALMVLAVLVAPQFYPYYPYFPFVGFSLMAGTWVGLVTARPVATSVVSSDPHLGARGLHRAATVGVMTGVVALGVLAVATVNLAEAWATNVDYLNKAMPPPTVISLAIPPGSCVVADGYAPVILAGRFIDGANGCSIEVDPFGDALRRTGAGPGSPALRFDDPLAQAWRERLLAADAVVMVGHYSSFFPWPEGQREWFDERFIWVPSGEAAVYVKR